METASERPLQIAMVPTPGMGHLIPLLALAKRLVHHHNLAITFIVPNDGSPMKPHKKLLQDQALPNSISSIFLPPVNFADLPEDVRIETRITLSLTRSLPALKESFKALVESTRVLSMVVDLFGMDAFDVAREFGVQPYVFFPCNAIVLSMVFQLPKLDRMFSCEYRDLPEPVKLPGCVPVHGSDLFDSIQDRKTVTYAAVLQLSKHYPLAAGFLVNSFMDLEPGTFKALMATAGGPGFPPVFPVGPLIQSGSVDWPNDCLKWLDQQTSGSVLYVCFGSGGTLSQEQLIELALGLEMSGQRFLWVVKSPHAKAKNATYFGAESADDPLDFMPEGFLQKTKGVGLVVPSWVPQVEVLRHSSTGGFLSHCGWNSSLESIVNGVPMIAWPLYAEQRMNAVLLAEDLKVAIRVKTNAKGLVGREDIAKHAKELIEGEDGKLVREKMRKLKEAAKVVLTEDGSSTESLAKVVGTWKNQEKEIK